MSPKLPAREAAAKACMTKKHTKKTLYLKLIQKGYEEKEARSAVLKMAELSYIDEKAYARAYISDAYKIKKYGAQKIRQKLNFDGVPEKIIEAEIEKAGFDERALIKDEINKRFKNCDDNKKIFSYFLRRGFNIDDIKESLYD